MMTTESFRDADYTVDITYDEAVARVQVFRDFIVSKAQRWPS